MTIAIAAVITDSVTFSRYAAPSANIAPGICSGKVALSANPANGDTLRVTLNREDGFGPVVTKIIPTTTNAKIYPFSFDLAPDPTNPTYQAAVKSDGTPYTAVTGINMASSGTYTFLAQDGLTWATDTGAIPTHPIASVSGAKSNSFTIVTVTPYELKQTYLRGLPLYAIEKPALLQQPALVTGVTLTELSRAQPLGSYPLAWDSVAQTLAWSDGLPVPIGTRIAANAPFDVPLPDFMGEYYAYAHVDPLLLPTGPVTETLTVDYERWDDVSLARKIQAAQERIAGKLGAVLEPRVVSTDVAGSHGLTNVFIDRGDYTAVAYRPPRAGEPTNFKLPMRPVLAIANLWGEIEHKGAMDVTPSWWQLHQQQGFVEIMPQFTLAMYSFVVGASATTLQSLDQLPNFWHYIAVAGLRSLDGRSMVVRELIGKQAAVEVMLQAGVALSGAKASEQIGRGAAQASQNRMAGGDSFQTIYAQYQADIPKLTQQAKNNIIGVPMVML